MEATALGNVLIQAVALNEAASLAEARERLAGATKLRLFEPRPVSAGAEARARYDAIERAALAGAP